MRFLWMLPQVVGLWLILLQVFALVEGEWLYGMAFGALGLLSIYVSLRMAAERG